MTESEAFEIAISETKKTTIAESAKWIRENVGANVAVDYLKAMEDGL